MGFIDSDDGFGVFSSVKKDYTQNIRNAESVDYKIKYDLINKKYSLKRLLDQLGIEYFGSNMYCPFHPDSLTGKPSAKYHEDSDLIYCFSESKVYSAYHALKLLMGKNMDEVFRSIWRGMSDSEKRSILESYGQDSEDEESCNPLWVQFKDVHEMFKFGKVSYRQHKNALYKIFNMMGEE